MKTWRAVLLAMGSPGLLSLVLVGACGHRPAETEVIWGSGGNTESGGAGAMGSGANGGSGGIALDILDQLRTLPGIEAVAEGTSEIPGYRFFLIDFDQPVDHAHPEGQHFTQRLALHHMDVAAPFVLAATGYYLYLPRQDLAEPAALLDANQLFVEQRYFYPSRPDPADWALLDIEQAAADHHDIVEAFRPLYSGKWLSTGASKGGMTSVFHRRFYPDDVDGTVAYVAPLSLGREDVRYADFLNQVGSATCRQRIAVFQREVLLRRSAMLTRMADQAASRGLGYDLIGLVPSFEGTVISFAFSFWQQEGQSSCASIPGPGASDTEVWRFFDKVGRTISATDPYVLGFEPYYWQAYTQLGTPGISTTHLDDLLTVDFSTIDDLPSIALTPAFDPAPMLDIASWVATEGSRLLFIYGQNDPWTSAAFELGGATDSYKLMVPNGNHSSRISGLSPPDRQTALDALEAWTGVTPSAQRQIAPPPAMAPPLRPRFRRGLH